jgi:ParB family chromosome partitioning protein
MGKRAAYQSKKRRAKKSLAKSPDVIAVEDKFLHVVGITGRDKRFTGEG